MKIDNRLATAEEQKELRYVGIPRLRLQYLKNSKKLMGVALWNVLEPKIKGYNYTPDSGVPTLSVDGLKNAGLI